METDLLSTPEGLNKGSSTERSEVREKEISNPSPFGRKDGESEKSFLPKGNKAKKSLS